MTKRPDLYAILEVPPSATQAEISHAYRALLRRHHPDTRAPDHESQSAASDTTLQNKFSPPTRCSTTLPGAPTTTDE